MLSAFVLGAQRSPESAEYRTLVQKFPQTRPPVPRGSSPVFTTRFLDLAARFDQQRTASKVRVASTRARERESARAFASAGWRVQRREALTTECFV